MIRQELLIPSPYLNAAGSLGFAPAGNWPLPEPQGAFITHPISRTPRKPAALRACLDFPGGLLLHTGLPNPGLSAVLRRYAARWQRSDLPIWAHIIPQNAAEAAEMVTRLEGVENVMAVELGLPPAGEAEDTLALVRAAQGELPLLVGLPLQRAREAWVAQLPALEVSALTLTAPSGALPVEGGALAFGRLFGPGLFPQVLAALETLRHLGIPLIAGSGVFRRAGAQALLAAGAAAVQVDAALWKGYLLDEAEDYTGTAPILTDNALF